MLKRSLAFIALASLLMGATPPAIQAEDWGMLFRGAHPRVLGLDGAYSLSVGGGKSLWSFGDTLIGQLEPNGDRDTAEMPFNTAAIVEDRDVLSGGGHAHFLGKPGPVLPAAKAATSRVWPLDLTATPGKLWHYYVTIAPFGHGALDFKVVETGIASAAPGPSPAFSRPVTLWPGEAPSFGGSVMQHGGWLYAYAGGGATHLARVSPATPDKPEAYTYYAGEGRWSPSWREAMPLPSSGPEPSVRWNQFLGCFVMIYVPPFGRTIEARFAPAPEGPWSEAHRVAECQPAFDQAAMFYGAKQHAQLDVDGGRQIFVSYNTNVAPSQLEARPDLYWPRLVRVTFSR
jgi:hypothetical protein